jgi:hypothetical protein
MSASVEQRDDTDSCRRWLAAIRIEHRLSLQEDTCHLQESVRDATDGAAMGMCEFRFNPAGDSDLMPATIPI